MMDEIRGMGKRNENTNFYSCRLTNVLEQSDHNFLLQCAYLSAHADTPFLRASFDILAHQNGERFYFYSPLRQNSTTWKSKQIGNVLIHYKQELNLAKAGAYQQRVADYDQRLNSLHQAIEFYSCDDFAEALKLVGVEYKADYNGVNEDGLSSYFNNRSLFVEGTTDTGRFNEVDPHDLWHDRLHIILSTTIINRPIDEGCAYLYGGSWGFGWPFVLATFKAYAASHPNADWVSLYTGTATFRDGPKPFLIPFAINALIVQKIEKEKGFSPVMEFLACGNREKGDANYFKALEKMTGVDRSHFSEYVWDLIRAEP